MVASRLGNIGGYCTDGHATYIYMSKLQSVNELYIMVWTGFTVLLGNSILHRFAGLLHWVQNWIVVWG